MRCCWSAWSPVSISTLIFSSGYLLTRSIGIEIGFADAALVLGMANLLSLIPVTIAGVGTRDAVFIFGFAALGLPAPQALAFSALVLGNFYLALGLVGLGCFLADRPATAMMTNGAVDPPAVLYGN